MRRLALIFWGIGLVTACNKQVEEQSTPEPAVTQNSDVETTPAQETVKPEATPKKPLVTCDSLGIPSYDYLIRELSALRCESCHGEKLAFNGVKLLTYEDYQTYRDQAKTRIETNMLTKPLDPIEQSVFLLWFEKGMPRSEKDCENKG